jgi:hypothetical protein
MKMKFLSVLACLLVIATSFVSCVKEASNSVDQDKIHVAYELFYDKNRDITEARATFRFSNPTGTLLELSNPSFVKFNNDQLLYEPVFSFYKKEYSGNITGGNFTFSDTKGKIFVNTISNVEPIAFPTNFTTINKANSYTLTWVGTPVGKGQLVGVGMGSTTAISGQLFGQHLEGATDIVLDANKLQSVATTNGQVVVVIDRYSVKTLEQGTSAGGELKSTYRAANKTVTLQ